MFRRRSQNHANSELKIDQGLCHSCGACVAVCPPDSLFLLDYNLTVNQETCTSCERCVRICPVHALSLVPVSQIQVAS